MNKKILIPIIVVLIIAAGVGAYFYWEKIKEPSATTTAVVTVDYPKELGTFSPYVFGTVDAPYFDETGFPIAQEAGFKMLLMAAPVKIPSNPDDPSQYDFSEIDKKVKATLDIGAKPLIFFPLDKKPSDISAYATYVKNVARHYAQGWNNGYQWNDVKVFRFGNEPDNAPFWDGTQQEWFETYAAAAKALKSVNPDFVIDALGLMAPRVSKDGGSTIPSFDNTDKISDWVTNFLIYAKNNNAPVDFVSIHGYSPLPYFTFYDNFRLVNEELKKYNGLSNLYGSPKLANDEWNTMVGDAWSGSYHKQFDTSLVASHNINGLINMVEQGLQMSVRMGGTFNDGPGGCHDFVLTDCNGQGKPVYYAFKGFNWLADTNRLSTIGTDHMNFAAIAGKSDNGIIVVISNYDVKAYMDKYEPQKVGDQETAWKEYNPYVSKYGEPKVYNKFNLTLNNLPWTSSQKITYERYLVDESHKLELVESETLSGSKEMKFSEDIVAPSVQVIKLRVK